MSAQLGPSLLSLPPEIREEIYSHVLDPANNRICQPDEYVIYDFRDALVLFKLNRQIYYESRTVFRRLNIFVRIRTPWVQAHEHVGMLGHVSVLLHGESASRFTAHTLGVSIEPPNDPLSRTELYDFVILLEELPKFTKLWYYDDLSSAGLNSHLRLNLELRDPYRADWEEKVVPKRLQKKLLLPFGILYGLRDVVFSGDIKPLESVNSEMRAAQAIPPDSPEKCLSKATEYKTAGNKLLKDGKYRDALAMYNKAWEAIHIIVKGRQRHAHADVYFSKQLTEDPYKGKHGQAERMVLRIQLVANTCMALLKLEEFDEVCFWGGRTISMVRHGLGIFDNDVPPEDEAQPTFPASAQLGKIYYRTGMAYKAMGEMARARRLLKVASIYLPRDASVQADLASVAIRIG